MRKTILTALAAVLLAAISASAGASVLDTNGILCLVNRSSKVSRDYIPDDLVTPHVAASKKSQQDKIEMRSEAAAALEKLFSAAFYEKGYVLLAVSGYRSFGIQQLLFSQKVEETGSAERAGRTVAPAGASEHQLGLAMDLVSKTSKELNRGFGGTPEGLWVSANAQRFGFIIRYKTEWTPITAYAGEPWHVRYIGIAHATAVHYLDIPLETYIKTMSQLPEFVLNRGNAYLLEGLYTLLATGGRLPEELAAVVPGGEDAALRSLSARFLPADITYEQALWAAYPTPMPTSAPYRDADTEEVTWDSFYGGD
jgi:zinc D-Ala-D-Ala carboxypeptidase